MEEVLKNSSDIEGLNCQTVFIGGEGYIIENPTAKNVQEACRCVSQMHYEGETTGVVQMMGDATLLAEGLSWLIKGDASLKETLSDSPLQELIEAWAIATKLMLQPNGILFTGELVRFAKSIIQKSQES